MIRRLTVRNFKRFASETFELPDPVVLAGPNNSGKSTLLQAISTWKFGLDYWVARRAGTTAQRRTGVPITRSEFTVVPLRQMNLLWENRQVAPRASDPERRRFIEISVEGRSWECGLEFQYANPEVVYVRPLQAKDLPSEKIRQFPPEQARDLKVVRVPALSGIEREEPRRDRGLQDLLVGQGRPGDILRNLLIEVQNEDWDQLVDLIGRLFDIRLDRPSYSPADPYIVCEYREGDGGRPLDLSNAGSGTLQVLLMLAFLYARPASVILLDEPDAHQHVFLQRRVYSEILKLARGRGAQLVVATHSDVVLDASDPENVYAFLGHSTRRLSEPFERDQLREAMKRLSTTDLLRGSQVGAVLYVEGPTDLSILAEWASVLGHPARKFFDEPFVVHLGGRSLKAARDHFFAMRSAVPSLRAICLLDGDNRDEPDSPVERHGMEVLRWHRYEIENYLLQPEAVKRFLGAPLFDEEIEDAFWAQVPRGTDLFGDHTSLARVKASNEFFVPLFRRLNMPVAKKGLFGIAAVMRESEIHPEVKRKLDRMAAVLTASGR